MSRLILAEVVLFVVALLVYISVAIRVALLDRVCTQRSLSTWFGEG